MMRQDRFTEQAQQVIGFLKEANLDLPLQFDNYRD